jgi:lysophospholipase L1-like esterase
MKTTNPNQLKQYVCLPILLLLTFGSSKTAAQIKRITVIGSSTAAGLGTTTLDSSWVRRTSNYYKNQLAVVDTVHNLGVSSTTVYQGMPTSYTAPASRPSPDASHNATQAISLLSNLTVAANGVVIVNYPTNGYDGYTIYEVMVALQVIYDSVTRTGNKCFIATTQPRSDGNFALSATKAKLAAIKDSIINRFGTTYTLNFWDGMYNTADTTILTAYSAGDNVHFNNTGHRILFNRVVAKNVFDPAATGDYRSNVTTTGLWSDAASWQKYNGMDWVTAITAPDNSSGRITIIAGDSIRINTATSMDQVTVESGAVLTIFHLSTPTTFTLSNGTGDDITVNGKLYISVNATLSGTGTIVNNSGGVFIIRNLGILSVNATNDGTMNISGTGFVQSATLVNNGTINLIDFTLDLNNATLTNNGTFNFVYNSSTFIASTVGTGIFNNTSTGTIYKSNAAGAARMNGSISFMNNGSIKGFSELVTVLTTINTGTIAPGNSSPAVLIVNPSLISSKSPTVNLEINTTGAVAGTNYDQLRFSSIDTLNTRVNGVTLNLIDNANDAIGTVYTVMASALGSITGTLFAANIPSNFGNLTYNSNSITIQKTDITKTWDGGAGTTNWNDANNWNPDGVPIVTDNLSIATGINILINTAAVCNDLTLNNSSLSATIQSGNSLTVNGRLALVLGNISINGQSLVLNGTLASFGTGTITGSATSSLTIGGTGGGNFGTLRMTATAPNNYVKNLILNRTGTGGTVTIGSNGMGLAGTLTLTNGKLITGGNLTLLSSSISSTALVAPINNGASISGLVTVERFIPQSKRAYRDIAPSVNSGSINLYNSWQESGTNSNGYGTHITGSVGAVGSIDASTGLDKTASGSKSMNSMNISNATGASVWETINNTNQVNDSLSAWKAYRISIRGNRQNDLSANNTLMNAPVILRSRGTLVTGQVNFTTTGVTANGGTNTAIRLNSADATGFSMIGNPYASPIDWETIHASSTNLSSSYWIFDPNMGTTGAYVAYNAALHTSSNNASAMNRYLQPGQGFFIRNNSSTIPILLIQESDKAADAANLSNVYRTTTTLSKIYANLMKQVGTTNYNMDGVGIAFSNDFSNGIGPEDGGKMNNATDNLAINNNGQMLSVEGRQLPTVNDTIKLKVWALTAGLNYQMKLNLVYFEANNLQPVLLDRFANTQTILALNTTTTYSFTITADTSSFNNRFRIAFTSAVLPINFSSIKAYKKNSNAEIEWACQETNAAYYEVEHSLTASNFIKLATVNASGSGPVSTYIWQHDNTPAGTNYYRIKSFDKSGTVKYSNTVSVNIAKNVTVIVYPNPVKESSFNLQFNGFEKSNFSVGIYNSTGLQIFSEPIAASTSPTHTINLKSKPPSGNYLLVITTSDGRKITTVIIIQ